MSKKEIDKILQLRKKFPKEIGVLVCKTENYYTADVVKSRIMGAKEGDVYDFCLRKSGLEK